jgi:hypothetical protein
MQRFTTTHTALTHCAPGLLGIGINITARVRVILILHHRVLRLTFDVEQDGHGVPPVLVLHDERVGPAVL